MNESNQALTPEEIQALAEATSEFAKMVHEQGGESLVFYPYTGPPPVPDFYLNMLRDMIEGTGYALGCITLGCGEYGTGTLPLMDVHPVEALQAILEVRVSEVIPPIQWIALCCDSYMFTTDDPNPDRGTATEAFQRGDPNATEALMALCVAPDGPGYNIEQPYVRSPDGIHWGAPSQTDIRMGEVPSLMEKLVTA